MSHTKKSLSLNEKYWRIFWKKFRRMGQQAEKRWDRKSNRTRQKNERWDSKVESNDSPEIPDRGVTSDITGLPSMFFVMWYQYYENTLKHVICTLPETSTQQLLPFTISLVNTIQVLCLWYLSLFVVLCTEVHVEQPNIHGNCFFFYSIVTMVTWTLSGTRCRRRLIQKANLEEEEKKQKKTTVLSDQNKTSWGRTKAKCKYYDE